LRESDAKCLTRHQRTSFRIETDRERSPPPVVTPDLSSSNFFPTTTTKMHRERTSYRFSAVPNTILHPPAPASLPLNRNSFKRVSTNNSDNVIRQPSPLRSPAPLSYRQQAAGESTTAPFFSQKKSHHSFFEKK
jgi:hypothetical protein